MVNFIKPYIMNIMMRKIIKKINCSIVFLALSQIIYAQDSNSNDSIPEILSYDKEVVLPFNSITARRSTGSVIIIDVEKELKRDQGATIFTAINGKVPGMFGNSNTWGTGNATVLVNGVRQSDFFVNSLNLMEVEEIVILKDAVSKAMYGVSGDNGLILVTTKHGKVGEHKVRVAGSYGASEPRAMPKYLNAADYMSRYNEAQLNDGVLIESLTYSQEAIDATRSGENPTRYPDNDFYTQDYIKDNTNNINIFADIAGGNENIQYYVNTAWNRSNGWLNTPEKDITDRLNFRGTVDFGISEYLKMSVNTTGRMTFNEQPNAASIWNTAANELPNVYPMTWDPSIIEDDAMRELVMSEANLVNGQVLGGNSSNLNNVYGNLTQRGTSKNMDREIQFNMQLDADLSFITKGLSAKLYGGLNFFNSINTNQDPSFAVYEPVFRGTEEPSDWDPLGPVFVPADSIAVVIHGADVAANRYYANANNSDFFRQTQFYGTLNYNRSFEEHTISATALLNGDLVALPDDLQKSALFNTGIVMNYMYANKYIVEGNFMGYGTRKLGKDDNLETASGIGLGWIMSEESFMQDVPFVNYLKLRSSVGTTLNDNWDNYFLYKDTYTRGGSLNYENGTSRNNETTLSTRANEISMQKRRDITFGVDAILFDNKMNVELGVFKSESLDNITQRSSTYPQILGYESLVFENFNSQSTEGIEFGLNYRLDVAPDFSVTAGANLLHISPKTTKREEPLYEGADAALTRTGTASDAMWGLKSDGLYSTSEFDFVTDPVTFISEWVMKDDLGLPDPLDPVQPGDIKYLDQNGDNIIDNLDRRIIGNSQRTQYSGYLDINYKNFGLFVLGVGSAGDTNYRSGSYFRVMGNVKYSTQANLAYGPNNLDVNAQHPRLSRNVVNNNNKNSDYWTYKNNTFRIPTVQLTYNIKGASETSVLKDARIYARATNVAVFGENKAFTEVRVGGSPNTRSLSLGLVTSF